MGLTRDFKETVQNRINRDPEFREELLKEEAHLVHKTIKNIFKNFRGILAADESDGTMANRLGSVGQESTPENRHSYRHTIFSTPDLKRSVGGVILFDETLRNKETIAPLIENDIALGIKVDKGAKPYFLDSNETLTEGLDGLDQRLVEYKELGAQFAKWRAVLLHNNSPQGLLANCWTLARYAKKCQSHGIIPIVEPEVLMNGMHSIEDSYRITRQALHILFDALHYEDVELEHTILKPNMIVSGYESKDRADAETVAKMTIKCFRNEVPCALPAIAFVWFGLLGIISHGMGRLFQFAGIGRIGAAKSATLLATTPLFATILAVTFLKERPTPLVILGGLAIVAGVILIVNEGRRREV